MMCFSSSTTSTFELIAAPIASIDHRQVRRLSYRCERNVNAGYFASPPRSPGATRVRAWLGRGGTSALFSPESKLQRIAEQTEPVADLLLQVAPVGEVQQVRVVDEQHHGRGLATRLGGVRKPEPPALVAGRGVLEERLTQDPVELTRRHPQPALPDHLERGRQHRRDPLPRPGRDG